MYLVNFSRNSPCSRQAGLLEKEWFTTRPLPEVRFLSLFNLSLGDLRSVGIARMVADEHPWCGCWGWSSTSPASVSSETIVPRQTTFWALTYGMSLDPKVIRPSLRRHSLRHRSRLRSGLRLTRCCDIEDHPISWSLTVSPATRAPSAPCCGPCRSVDGVDRVRVARDAGQGHDLGEGNDLMVHLLRPAVHDDREDLLVELSTVEVLSLVKVNLLLAVRNQPVLLVALPSTSW